jgi:hypothetical protein
MSTETTNLQLVKPTEDDFYDINLINGNMDKIDAAVAAKETPAGAQDKVDAHATAVDPHTGYIKKSLATAVNDFIVASAPGVFVKKTLAEIKTILGLGSAAYTASTAYATAAQGTKADNAATQASVNTHLADYVRQPGYGVTGGVANTYTVTLNPAPTALLDGMGIVVKIHATSTGAITFNVNGLGAKPAVDSKGNAFSVSKTLLQNGRFSFRYSATLGNFQLQGEGGEYGTALAGDVRNTKTVGTENGITAGTLDLSNLTAPNVKLGVTVDNVLGTHNEIETLQAGNYLVGEFPRASTSYVCRTANTTVYVKGKFFVMQLSGTVRVKFLMESAYDDGTAYGQIYVNNVARGTARYTSSESGVWFTEDITVIAGDTVEIWMKSTGSSGDNYSYINQFQLFAHAKAPTVCALIS